MFGNMNGPDDEEKKRDELVRRKLLDEWKMKNQKADADLAGAERDRAYLEGANAVGSGLTEISNSKQKDTVLYGNAFRGEGPKLMRAEDKKWDGSHLSKLGGALVDSAKARKDQAFGDIQKEQALSQADRENKKWADSEAVSASMRDPTSEESILAREALAKMVPDAAKNPKFQSLTAEQVAKLEPRLFEREKLDASERSADKRLKAQLDAEDRRMDRKEKEGEKKDKELKYKRSTEVREVLNKNPAFTIARETDLRLAQVDELMKDPNGVGDEAILVMYQKALDPGSIVRESEFARTAEGQSLVGRLDTMMKSYKKGDRMGAELKKNVLGAMKAIQRGNRVHLNRMVGPYEREIRDYGLDRSIIFGDGEGSADAAAPLSSSSSTLKSAKDLP